MHQWDIVRHQFGLVQNLPLDEPMCMKKYHEIDMIRKQYTISWKHKIFYAKCGVKTVVKLKERLFFIQWFNVLFQEGSSCVQSSIENVQPEGPQYHVHDIRRGGCEQTNICGECTTLSNSL